MWTIPKTIDESSFSNQSLKFFDLSGLNVNAQFFRSKASLTQGSSQNPVTDNTRPDIIKDIETILTPIYSGFLFELPGLWQSTELTKAININKLNQDTYFWLNNTTYIISNNTAKSFIGSIELEVTDETNFGTFDNTVTKVVSNGLTLDFTQVNGELIIIPSSRSCRARVGDFATVYFSLTYPQAETSKKAVNIFSKQNLNISLATYFIYNNEDFYISNTLEANTLINIEDKKFLTISIIK